MSVGKRAMLAMGLALAAAVAQAGVTVTNVVVQQRWPWNGLVDIDYEVVCDNTNSDVYVYPTALDRDTNLSTSPRTLTGEGADGRVRPGRRRAVWDAARAKVGVAMENRGLRQSGRQRGADERHGMG